MSIVLKLSKLSSNEFSILTFCVPFLVPNNIIESALFVPLSFLVFHLKSKKKNITFLYQGFINKKPCLNELQI